MNIIKKAVAILLMLCLGMAGTWLTRKEPPKRRIAAPTTRYHGYELNRLAISRAKDFTVLLSNEGFGGVGRGTGVLIDSTHVLTCAHMIDGPNDDMWVFPYPADIVVKGKPVAIDKGDDLLVLELSKPVIRQHYATFMDMHYDGEPITIIGNTMGSMKWFISFGIVSGDWRGYILTDGVLYGGNSGGPWINEKGEVVALTDFTFIYRGKDSGVHGGVSAKTINAFLTSWKTLELDQLLRMLMGGAQ